MNFKGDIMTKMKWLHKRQQPYIVIGRIVAWHGWFCCQFV